MSKTYVFHTDPGHGWLAVKRKELKELGIEKEISSYSYQRGKTVYLEEDADAQRFLAAKKAKGDKVDIRSSHQENTPIRYYDAFSPED